MRKALTLSLFALVATMAPLFAGEVYIPFASNQSTGGVLYKTSVWVSNPSAVDRRFTTTFIGADTDGSAAQQAPGSITVRSGGTLLLTGVAPTGSSGILEISGAPQLVVNARLDAVGANGNIVSSTNVPPVSQENVMAANAVAELQGLKRSTDGTISDFAMVNLSRSAAQCTVKGFRSDGTSISSPVVLTLKPLSQRQFNEVLAALGAPSISDARLEVSCNQQFFAFAKVYQPSGPQSAFISPSPTLVGDLVPGGPSAPGVKGAVVMDVPGTFLRAVQNNSYISYDFPAPAGVAYKQATIEFDMGIGKLSTVLLFTGVTSFRRPSGDRNQRVLYYGIQIVNRNSKTTLDLGVPDVLVKTDGPWKENHNYHVKLVYDMTARQVSLQTYEGGVLTYTIAGNIQHFDLSANGNPLRVDFGQTGIADGAYAPPIGWTFSNLHATLIPQ